MAERREAELRALAKQREAELEASLRAEVDRAEAARLEEARAHKLRETEMQARWRCCALNGCMGMAGCGAGMAVARECATVVLFPGVLCLMAPALFVAIELVVAPSSTSLWLHAGRSLCLARILTQPPPPFFGPQLEAQLAGDQLRLSCELRAAELEAEFARKGAELQRERDDVQRQLAGAPGVKASFFANKLKQVKTDMALHAMRLLAFGFRRRLASGCIQNRRASRCSRPLHVHGCCDVPCAME